MHDVAALSCPTAAKAYFQRQECPICYDELAKKPVTCLSDARGQIVCDHRCHAECVRQRTIPNRCPICNKSYSSCSDVPPLDVDARAWFSHIDKDNNGALNYEEIISGLKDQLALDWQRIEVDVDRMWPTWDKDRSGTVSFEEFSNPRTGVVAYLSSHYRPRPQPTPPDITKSKEAWFRFWDEDHSGSLDKDEVTRALIKTFRLHHVPHETVIDILSVVWPIFDYDGSGKIDLREFCSQDNLGDTVVAQLLQEARSRK